MDINVRITTTAIVVWIAWLGGSAFVALDTLGVLHGSGQPGLLIAMFGSIAWIRSWFCVIRQRELVAFDQGRKFERAQRDLTAVK